MAREPVMTDGPQQCRRAQSRRQSPPDAIALSATPHCSSAQRVQSNTDSKLASRTPLFAVAPDRELVPRAFLNSAVSSSSRQRQLRALNELRPDD